MPVFKHDLNYKASNYREMAIINKEKITESEKQFEIQKQM